MIDVTILWPNSDDARFDEEYYLQKHIPLVRRLFGDKLKRAEVAKGVRGLIPGGPPELLVMTHFYFDSVDDFQTVFAPNVEQITGDERNFTNIPARVQISEIVL